MVKIIMVTGKMVIPMVRGFIILPKEMYMKESLKMEKRVAQVSLLMDLGIGKEIYMKANGRMIREVDMGLLHSGVENSKEKSMMVSGEMANETEKELMILLMARVL